MKKSFAFGNPYLIMEVLASIILLSASSASAKMLQGGIWCDLSNPEVVTSLGDVQYDMSGNPGFQINSLEFRGFTCEMNSSRNGANYSCIYTQADTPYIRLRPISNSLTPNNVTIKMSCPEGMTLSKVTFYDKEERAFGVKAVSTTTGSLNITSKKEFSWEASEPEGAQSFEAVVTSGGNNTPSEFRIYYIGIDYLIDTNSLEPIIIEDYFDRIQYSWDQPELPSSVDFFQVIFNYSLFQDYDCTEKCTLSLGNEIIKTFSDEELSVYVLACDGYSEEDGDDVHEPIEECIISCRLDPPLTTPGLYTFTIPDNFLTKARYPTKGMSVPFIIKDENTGVTPMFIDGEVTVITATGVCLMRNAPADALSNLPSGLYIVNGKKIKIK